MPLSFSSVTAISATALPPFIHLFKDHVAGGLSEAQQGQTSVPQPKQSLVSQLLLLTCYDPFSTLHLKKKNYSDITSLSESLQWLIILLSIKT